MDRHPAVRLFLSLATGILIGEAVDIPVLFVASGLAAAVAAVFWGRARIGGVAWLLVLASAGALWIGARNRAAVAPLIPGRQRLLVLVSGEPRMSGDKWVLTAMTEAVEASDGTWSKSKFRAAVRIPDYLGVRPEHGDRLSLDGEWRLAGPARNPGGFDYRHYLEHLEVAGILSAVRAELVEKTGGDPVTAKLVIPTRRYIRSLVSRHLGGDEAALTLGLMLGERNDLSLGVRDAFSNTGTTHVLAVSGLHVVLVAFILYMLLRAAQLPRRWSAAGTVAGLAFYTLLTGSPPSIVRATIMSAAVIAGNMFERRGSGINMLGLSGMLILCFWPQALFDVGFQLSYAATFGILALTRPIEGLLFRATGQSQLRAWLLTPLAVSAAAQLATTPLLAYHFHRVPLVSLVANLAVVPLTNFLLALGLAMSLLGLFFQPLTAPLAAAAYVVSWMTLRLVDLFAGWSWATVSWSRPDILQVCSYLLLVLLAFGWTKLGRWRPVVMAGLLLSANVLVWRRALAGPPRLEVHFMDVGQGDAALVRFPNGRTLLIDAGMGGFESVGGGGYDNGRRVVVPFLRYLGVGRIDRMLVTHADADHCGGAASVLGSVRVDGLVTTHHYSDKPVYLKTLDAASRKRVPVHSLRGYDTLAGVWPARGFIYSRPDTMENGNESSLVCYIEYGAHSFLFTGDMGPELQGHLLRQGLLRPCTVLKVPHHGAGHNNGRGLAEVVRPAVAVVSVGEFNRFGHPSPQALENYRATDARILRTDLCGAVTLSSDGEECLIRTMLEGQI